MQKRKTKKGKTMQIVIDIPKEVLKTRYYTDYFGCGSHKLTETLDNATPIPDNATNGDVIKAMFGADKVFGFIHYVHLRAKVGNWFNEGVVAEFNRGWWDEPYQKGDKE